MANVRINKQDKKQAVEAMVLEKYNDRYKRLVTRAQQLTLQVYDETVGKVGNALQKCVEQSGSSTWHWLNSKAELALEGVPAPKSIVKTGTGSSPRHYCDLFSGRLAYVVEDAFKVQLPRTVAWPDRHYVEALSWEAATKPTQKKVKLLQEQIDAFNSDVSEFRNNAEYIVDSLRTSKQIDDRLPELWRYLPAGVRERIKQAVVPMDQSFINEFRKKLPK